MSAQPSEALAPIELIPEAPGFVVSVVRRLRSDPLGLLGLLIVLTVIVLAIIGPSIAPYSPFKIKVPERFMPPTLLALGVGGGSIAIALTIGLMLGLIAGYGPRWLDNFLMLLFDSIYSFPTVILGLTVMTLLGPSIPTLMFVVVVIQTPAYARLIRTATLATKSSEYILAIRSLGSSPGRILLVHILPNIIGPLFIVASMDIPSVIALEAGLTYLGLGIPPPTPSWGRILQEGFESIRDAPWIVVAGGIPLILTTLGFTFLGESLRDLLDPKLRRIV